MGLFSFLKRNEKVVEESVDEIMSSHKETVTKLRGRVSNMSDEIADIDEETSALVSKKLAAAAERSRASSIADKLDEILSSDGDTQVAQVAQVAAELV